MGAGSRTGDVTLRGQSSNIDAFFRCLKSF